MTFLTYYLVGAATCLSSSKVTMPTAGPVVPQGTWQRCATGRTKHLHQQHQWYQKQSLNQQPPKKQWGRKIWPDPIWLQRMEWSGEEVGDKSSAPPHQQDVLPNKDQHWRSQQNNSSRSSLKRSSKIRVCSSNISIGSRSSSRQNNSSNHNRSSLSNNLMFFQSWACSWRWRKCFHLDLSHWKWERDKEEEDDVKVNN